MRGVPISKPIKKFISAFVIIQFIIFIPYIVKASIPWEKQELIGAYLHFDSETVIESFNFINDKMATCHFGTAGTKGAIAPCLCNWHIDTNGALVIPDGCEGTITLIKIRSTKAFELMSVTETIDVLRNGEPRVYKFSKPRFNSTTLLFILLALFLGFVGMVWAIVRWWRNRRKKNLNEKDLREPDSETT